MNKNMICPVCGADLKVDHYQKEYKPGLVLTLSRLICVDRSCKFVREPKIPDKIYSEIFLKEVGKMWD